MGRRRQQDRPQRPRHFHRQGQEEEQTADGGGSLGVGGQDQRIEGALGREEGGEEVMSLVYGYTHFSVSLQRTLRFSVRASVASKGTRIRQARQGSRVGEISIK